MGTQDGAGAAVVRDGALGGAEERGVVQRMAQGIAGCVGGRRVSAGGAQSFAGESRGEQDGAGGSR